MRSLGGLVLLAGIGVGLFVYLPAPVSSRMSLEQASRSFRMREEAAVLVSRVEQAAKPATRRAAVHQETAGHDERLRAFSPGISLTTLTTAQPASLSDAPATVTLDDTPVSWQAVVNTSAATTASGTPLMPTDPATRYKLITEIQQQLKRVGCYYGRVDGSWGISSKYAMRSFTERVNAELPLDEPDYLLLSLLRSHNGSVCGSCPPGLITAADGRCVAPPTIAQTRPANVNGSQQAATTLETLPWKAPAAGTSNPVATAARPLFTPVGTSVVSSEPLPGRMAIGGPRALPPVDAANTDPAVTPTPATAQPVAAVGLTAAVAAQPRPSELAKHRASRRSYSNHSDPIRRNLMLSLGGAY